MAIEFIPTRVNTARPPATEQLIGRIREQSNALGLDDGILYYGWPKFTDYDAVRHYVDLAIVSARIGVVLIRILPHATVKQVTDAAESISQAAAAAVSQLV